MGRRTLKRLGSAGLVRFWTDGDRPDGAPDVPEDARIFEWTALRLCDPTSYALLGVTQDRSFAFDANEQPFPGAVAGPPELVNFGLPASYAQAASSVLDRSDLAICVAAHAAFGSSEKAFVIVAEFLVRTLEVDLMAMPTVAVWETEGAVKQDVGYYG